MIGTELGPYVIERELGSGGMGTVYAGRVAGDVRGLDAGTLVALKFAHPGLLASEGFFKRFLREADIGRSVQHDNVVRTYDADALVVDGAPHHFLVMEYVEGQTLRRLLDELGQVPEELCRHIGREVARALAAIHASGIVHRDIKPENVLMTDDHVVKVMDLGVARLQDEALRLSQTGAFVGSLHYAAPEAFQGGGENIDGRADLHALGLVLYELAAGTNPYVADGVAQSMRKVLHETPRRLGDLNPQLSPFFEEVVHTLLAKDPDKRFASAADLLRALDDGEESTWWQQRASVLRALTKRPLRRVRIPRETAVFGRDDELARLRRLFDEARTGSGRVVLIEGEAGIGKTRLVDEFVGRLRADGVDVNFLFGSYPPGGAATIAGAFSTAYREQFGDVGSSQYLPSTPLLVPAFDGLLRGEPPPEGTEPLTKESLQTCFVHATRALASERPTIVLIDDLHFAPEEGRALFTSLALAVPEHAVLLVGTHRPGVPGDWLAGATRLEQTSQISLQRLGPKDLAALLEDAFRSERLAEELGFRIGKMSDGNPFFAFEIIRGLRDGQYITRSEDGSWVSTGVIDEIELPTSVKDLIDARVSDLSEEERELLDVAACCGYEFDPSLVAEALELAVLPTLRSFARIERAYRLIRSAGRVYVFDHHQVQEALHAGLFDQLREHYHLAIAEAVEARAGGADGDPSALPGPLAVDVCEHFLAGGAGARALRYLDVSLDHLDDGLLNDQLIALADRALSLADLVGAPRLDLLLRKAKRLELVGRPDDERAALDQAELVARSLDDEGGEARVLCMQGWHQLQHSRHDEARTTLEEAIRRARSAGDRRTESTAIGHLASLCWRLGRHAEFEQHTREQCRLAIESGHREGEGVAANSLGILALETGRFDEAREQFERQLALAREVKDRRGEAGATGNLGVVCWRQGRYEEARSHFQRGLEMAREVGHRRGVAMSLGHLGNVASMLGEQEEARRYMQEFLALARETGDLRNEANALGNLGSIAFSLGRCAEALAYHRRYETLARDLDQPQGRVVAAHNQGETWVLVGRDERARERFETARDLADELGVDMLATHTRQALAGLAARSGEVAAAERLLTEAVSLARERGADGELAGALVGLGSVIADDGRADTARPHLVEALELGRTTGLPNTLVLAACHLALLPGGEPGTAEAAFAEAGSRLDHGAALHARHLLWKITGDRAHLDEAYRLLEVVRNHAPEACRGTVMDATEMYRDIVAARESERPVD